MKRDSEQQGVRARKIDNSVIEQIIGNKYVLAVAPVTKPIYLTYADSDVQALYLSGEPHASARYANALDEAVRLLICFKPPQSHILLGPSSLVQSRLTRNVLLPHLRESANNDYGQILLLRRESSWAEYFDKRQQNVETLRAIESFAEYFDQRVIQDISVLPSSRKKFFSGASTVDNWAHLLHCTGHTRGASVEQTVETAHDSLHRNAFVFETSLSTLDTLNIDMRPSDARSILIDAYIASVATGCAVPTSIRLAWDPCPAGPNQEYISIAWLYHVATQEGLLGAILGGSVREVQRFARSSKMQFVRTKMLAHRHG